MSANKAYFDSQSILSLIPAHVYWMDVNNVFMGCNLQQAKSIGLKSPEEIIGKTIYDFHTKEDAELIIANNLRVMKLKESLEFQEPLTLSDGRKGWVTSKKSPILDESAKVVGLLGVSLDTSATKNLLDQVMAHLPLHLYWKDKSGIYLGCNRQQAISLGFNGPEKIIGKTDLDITKDKHEAERFRKNDLEVMTGRSIKAIEENAVFDGKDSIVLSQKAPLFDDADNVIGIVGTSIDITALKHSQERERISAVRAAEEKAQAEAEKELRQAVMILAGSIAHDLRTPISVINMIGGSVQRAIDYLLKMYRKSGDDKFSDEQLDDLENIGESLKNTSMQMHDYIEVTLRTLSRGLKGGLVKEDLVECSMWHCIYNTILRYPFSSEAQNKLVNWDQRDFKFMGNELLTIRIFSNLITNSLQQIQKNKKGQIFISTEKQGSQNIIKFKDTAGGASPEIVNHLFDGYRTTKEKGTGIGLAFCKMTLESFGGSIHCYSVEGDYIEFVLIFPEFSLY